MGKKMNFHQRSPKERAEAGPLARRPMVGDVQQAKPRRQQCTRRTVKKVRMEAIPSLRWSKVRIARMTLIQKLLQQRKQRSLQPRRSRQREGRKEEAGHQDQQLPRRKSQAQSTTSMTSPTPLSSLRKAQTTLAT